MFSIDFKCDQCEYTNINEKGLAQHKRMKHRMSQVGGVTDFNEDLDEHSATVMDSIKSESEKEKIDRHIKSIPLENLTSLYVKELAELQADITRKVLQEIKTNV